MSCKETLSKIISDNYNMEISNLMLLDKYFGTEIYLLETNIGKHIVKTLPLAVPNLENEGSITEFLHNNGISVARLMRTQNGNYVIKTDSIQFHVQEFIKGEVLKVNTAPRWLMEKSAYILGRIHDVLQSYGELSVCFGSDFFQRTNVIQQKQHYVKQLDEAIEKENFYLIFDLEERIKHLERISAFEIDSTKLTYSNSHGDFYIGQIIVNNEDITVIDWTSACKLPISLEVIMSYVFANPDCKNGKIDGDGLKRYISHYSKHFCLNDYDIKIMPYLLYFQQIMCHYSPPYDGILSTYKPVCNLINNFTSWLYDNAENLENELYK